MSETLWCWSTDNESFHGSWGTRKTAIAEAVVEHGLEEGDTLYIGHCHRQVRKELAALADIDAFLESVDERAYEKYGDLAEGWLSEQSDEDRELLVDAIRAALAAGLPEPGFFGVKNVEEITLTAEDVRDE